MVDLIVDDLAFRDATASGNVRAFSRASLESLVIRVVRAEGVVELEPTVRDVVSGDVAERTRGLLLVELFVQREEWIVEDTRLARGRRVRIGHHVRAMQSARRIEPWLVVE